MNTPIATSETYRDRLKLTDFYITLNSKAQFNQLVHTLASHLPFKLSRTRDIIAMSMGDFKSVNALLAAFGSSTSKHVCVPQLEFVERLRELSFDKFNTALSEISVANVDYVLQTMEDTVFFLSPYDYPYFCGIDKLIESVKVSERQRYAQTIYGEANQIHSYFDAWKAAKNAHLDDDAATVYSIPSAKENIENQKGYVIYQADTDSIAEFSRVINLVTDAEDMVDITTDILTTNKNWRKLIPLIITNKQRFHLAFYGLVANAQHARGELLAQITYFHKRGFDLKEVTNCRSLKKARPERREYPNILLAVIGGYSSKYPTNHEEYHAVLDYLFDVVGFECSEVVEQRLVETFSIPIQSYLEKRNGKICVDISNTIKDLIWFRDYEKLNSLNAYFSDIDYSQIIKLLPRNTKLFRHLNANEVYSHEKLMDNARIILPMIIKGLEAGNRGHQSFSLGLFYLMGIEQLCAVASPQQQVFIQTTVSKMLEENARSIG